VLRRPKLLKNLRCRQKIASLETLGERLKIDQQIAWPANFVSLGPKSCEADTATQIQREQVTFLFKLQPAQQTCLTLEQDGEK
jgi:hypothetical protein